MQSFKVKLSIPNQCSIILVLLRENPILLHAKNKGADQPAYTPSLKSTFCYSLPAKCNSVIATRALCKLVPADEQTDLFRFLRCGRQIIS